MDELTNHLEPVIAAGNSDMQPVVRAFPSSQSRSRLTSLGSSCICCKADLFTQSKFVENDVHMPSVRSVCDHIASVSRQ